jgi:hypothetical protein
VVGAGKRQTPGKRPSRPGGFHPEPLPGRTEARSGLRMMPTFPPSPLKFRTAGFPQSGFKVGISGGAFPSTTSPACCAVCLRPSCTPLPASYPRSEPRGAVRWRTSVQAAVPLCPRGPRSSPGCSVPDHHHLIGPMRSTHRHISISPTRLIRDALAVRPNSTPRRPASGSVLSLGILCQACRPLRPREADRLLVPSSFTDHAGLRLSVKVSALPTFLTLRFP